MHVPLLPSQRANPEFGSISSKLVFKTDKTNYQQDEPTAKIFYKGFVSKYSYTMHWNVSIFVNFNALFVRKVCALSTS